MFGASNDDDHEYLIHRKKLKPITRLKSRLKRVRQYIVSTGSQQEMSDTGRKYTRTTGPTLGGNRYAFT